MTISTISEMESTRAPERRGPDRRSRATPALSRYTLFGGRRAGDRRSPGSPNQYVDLYEPWMASAMIAIGVLCALDAAFTLVYLQKGGSEANPLMAAIIEWGPIPFVLIKCGLTNVGLCVLCLHKNFGWVKRIVAGLVGMYVALLFYHFVLAAMAS